MKHNIKINKIGQEEARISIELIPENENESIIISNVANVNASEEEHQKVDYYLTQRILEKGFAPVRHLRTRNRIFEFMCTRK